MPAGGVDAGETFVDAGRREGMEESNIDIVFKGWLAVEFLPQSKRHTNRGLRTIIYGEPRTLEGANNPKNWADNESVCAEWKTLAELEELQS